MASKTRYEAQMQELDYLDKAQAMAYVHRCEQKFDEEIAPWCHKYRGGKGFLYKKAELAARQESLVEATPTYVSQA